MSVRPFVRSSERSFFSFSRIKSVIFLIAIPDPIFVLVQLFARLSESGDSSAWSFVSKPAFRITNLNKFFSVKFDLDPD